MSGMQLRRPVSVGLASATSRALGGCTLPCWLYVTPGEVNFPDYWSKAT